MKALGWRSDSRREQTRAVYGLLELAANAGKPCPSNADLMQSVRGLDHPERVRRALSDLKDSGEIAVETLQSAGRGKARVVTVLSPGKTTFDPRPVPVPRVAMRVPA